LPFLRRPASVLTLAFLVRCRDKAKSMKHTYKTLNSILLLTSAANDMKSILFCPPWCHFSSKVMVGPIW
ncbi:MAG: hypothetical protein ACYSR9_09575, partial [Planctomycetota bacterium]